MGKPRLVIVTRTFWPLVGAVETTAARLAVGLVDAGWDVTILTRRQHASWPPRIHFHDAVVERVGPPEGRRWGQWRYRLALRRWLRRHAACYDVVYVFGMQEEAGTVLRAVGRRRPVVLRDQAIGASDVAAAGAAPEADDVARRRLERAWSSAAAVVCVGSARERQIVAAGCPAERIHVIPDGVSLGPTRTDASRMEARSLLAAANQTLRLPEWAPLAVYLGPLRNDRGLEYLTAAWPPIGLRWPSARLWLVGDGPFRDGLRRQISGFKLSGRAMLLGRFDHVDELLAAADVLVHPGECGAPSLSVAEAMGAGLPVIAADCPGHRLLVEHNRTGLLVPPGNVAALTEAMIHLFDAPATARRLGQAAQEDARRHHALAKMVGRHVVLFQSLRQASRSA